MEPLAIIEKVKALLAEEVAQGPSRMKLSAFLKDRTGYSYGYIAELFAKHERQTAVRYLVGLKIARAKELLTGGGKNVNEIADALGYGSTAHFCRQFKKETGVTPGSFRGQS